MRSMLAVAAKLAASLVPASSQGAEREPIVCADLVPAPGGAPAFDTYCARCHDARKVARSYFAGADVQEANRREVELAAFLDRHSNCPHQHHEAVAAWLREIYGRQ